jgi:hypothetical protein
MGGGSLSLKSDLICHGFTLLHAFEQLQFLAMINCLRRSTEKKQIHINCLESYFSGILNASLKLEECRALYNIESIVKRVIRSC